MTSYSRTHLSDQALLHDLATRVGSERGATADLLASIAEVDARRLYAPAGHPSMFSYCVHELGLSEDATAKRIHAARAARCFPVIFPALADGRLHLSAVVLLAPYLTEATADSLLSGAERKTKAEVEQLLAERFPRSELLPWLTPNAEYAPGHTAGARHPEAGRRSSAECDLAPPAPARAEGTSHPAKLAPLSGQRFEFQVSFGQRTHDKLRYAQALLSHSVPSGDLAEVLDRALDALIAKLEKRKFAATDHRRHRSRRPGANPRCIPADVKRVVSERDGGQCTFVSEAGHRCASRKCLQFDHVDPVARGGQATIANLRLRCRAHNQLEAERVFGKDFMDGKRQETRLTAQRARGTATSAPAHVQDVVPYLRSLGFRVGEAHAAAALCQGMPDASLEHRVRTALSYFHRQGDRRRTAP